MGSKNLKSVAVKGRSVPRPADPEKFREMARWMNANYMNVGNGAAFHELGTGDIGLMVGGNSIGNLPVRNWSDGSFEAVEKITADAVRDTYRVGMEACPAPRGSVAVRVPLAGGTGISGARDPHRWLRSCSGNPGSA
jgi:aldehyde:ferredoxin oxidoreductase